MSKSKIVVGLDLSLRKTGYAITTEGGKVLASGLIKSEPSGDKPIDETKRIVAIANSIINTITPTNGDIDLIMIENLAFMARNTTALTQLSGLSYILRSLLVEMNHPWVLCAPTTLKKFITQKGNADKNMMMMDVYKDYGFESRDDNECDAFSLSVCGLALLGKPVNKLTKAQEEVLAVLRPQLP